MIPAAIVEVNGVDISCNVQLGVSIAHGRADATSQPDPATASLELVATDRSIVDMLTINATVTVDAKFGDGDTVRRFEGTITDVAIAWADVDVANVSVTAASPVAMLGRTFIGDTPWPAEDDGARAEHILSGSGVPVGQIDPGTVNVLARDVDKQPCLSLLQDLAKDCGGMAWHTRDGLICYADNEHRRNTPTSIILDACQILMSPKWEQTTNGLVNDVTVAYGLAPEGEEQPTFRRVNQQSIDAYGLMAVSDATQLADLADATTRAEVAVARGAFPAWNIPEVPVNLSVPQLDEAATRILLGLEQHDLISVTGLPSQGPASTATLWVEGWAETISAVGATGAGSWEIVYAVTDYCRTSAFVQWDDVPPAATWDTIDPSLTWDHAYCIGPIAPGGERWNDVPTNLRWDAVPASVTWDTWDTWDGA